jgi:hypothetical protein
MSGWHKALSSSPSATKTPPQTKELPQVNRNKKTPQHGSVGIWSLTVGMDAELLGAHGQILHILIVSPTLGPGGLLGALTAGALFCCPGCAPCPSPGSSRILASVRTQLGREHMGRPALPSEGPTVGRAGRPTASCQACAVSPPALTMVMVCHSGLVGETVSFLDVSPVLPSGHQPPRYTQPRAHSSRRGPGSAGGPRPGAWALPAAWTLDAAEPGILSNAAMALQGRITVPEIFPCCRRQFGFHLKFNNGSAVLPGSTGAGARS